jgi:hypothetical protein
VFLSGEIAISVSKPASEALKDHEAVAPHGFLDSVATRVGRTWMLYIFGYMTGQVPGTIPRMKDDHDD